MILIIFIIFLLIPRPLEFAILYQSFITPNENFNGIFYNPLFFDNSISITEAYALEHYLSHIAVTNSVASVTSFAGVINADNGLTAWWRDYETLDVKNYIKRDGININSIYQTISGMILYSTKSQASLLHQQLGSCVLTQDIGNYFTISSYIINHNCF